MTPTSTAAEPYTGTIAPLSGHVAVWTCDDWEGRSVLRWVPVVGSGDGEILCAYGSQVYRLCDHLEEMGQDPELVDLIPIGLLSDKARAVLVSDLGLNRYWGSNG